MRQFAVLPFAAAVLLLFSGMASAHEGCPLSHSRGWHGCCCCAWHGGWQIVRCHWPRFRQPPPLAANFSAYYYNSRGGVGRGYRTTAYSTDGYPRQYRWNQP